MPYQTMIPILKAAQANHYAVPAFNILNHITARSIVDTCEEARSPVILQTSVATVKQFGVQNLAEFLIPMAKNASIPVAIHLDHCKEDKIAKQCIDCGWSSIMIDYSSLPLEDNILRTREIVEYASGNDISIEGELGAVGGVEDDISVEDHNAHLANEDDSLRFIERTGIHVFAPAIGTAHGLYKSAPRIDFELLGRMTKQFSLPIVIHGGTGLDETVFRRLIELGAAKINISTALKNAYLDGAVAYLEAGAERNPLKMDLSIMESVRKMALEHIRIFGSSQRVHG